MSAAELLGSVKPADATPEEWAAAVRLTFATARGLSSLQGIPSHWLEAMRDRALGVKTCGECNGTGERFTHADDCNDDLCALNGDMHSCTGKVEVCTCGVRVAELPGVTMAGDEAHFFAVRLRRLCAHLNYTLPKFADDDEALINVAGSVIGALLTNMTHGVKGPEHG